MANINVQGKLPASPTTTNTLPANGVSDTPVGLAFDAVLQQQVGAQPDTKMISAVDDPKIRIEKELSSGKIKQDADTANTTPTTDAAANMIALLQPLQEVRAPHAPQNIADDSSGKIVTDKSAMTGLPAALTSKRQDGGVDKNLASSIPGKPDAALKDSPFDVQQPSTTFLRSHEQIDLPVVSEKSASQIALTPNVALQNPAELMKVAVNAVTPASDNTKNSISTPLGAEGWQDEFAQKITWMTTTQKDQIAELHLNPPDLGPLDVVLKISDSQATATFTSAHNTVREAVENAIPKLREILADNGITLGNTTVSDQAPRDSNASTFSGQQSYAQGNRSTQPDTDEVRVLSATPVSLPQGRRHNGMVDTFA